MPKSQQVLVGICLILFSFNFIAPIIGTMMHIKILEFNSPLIKTVQFAFVIIFGVLHIDKLNVKVSRRIRLKYYMIEF